MVLLMKLETIEHARFRALAQIQLDSEKGVEAFEEYMKMAFPYMEGQKARDKEEFMKRLNAEVMRGPIAVTAVKQEKVRSKLKTRMVQRGKPQTKDEADALYKKLGDSIPLR